MAVKTKMTKSVEKIIEGGGNVRSDKKTDEYIKFTLALPKPLVELIDEKRNNRIDKVTRTRWINEAILRNLNWE